MSIYNKLIYMAANPYYKEIILCNEKGEELKSSKAILKEIKKEFSIGSSQLSVDFRQACETRVID
ncbi:hypothetical protein ACQUW5_05415 [Legionella sp. CNM-1927-20]|uniref:hypothetical protein n=1 Tax=Legionella sp. CNM-1927-20 TaxID=3422221 RepID=UPI00403AEB07